MKPIHAVIAFCLFLLSTFVGCTNITPPEKVEFEASIDTFKDAGKYETHPDSSREMTHEDSIKFGLIDEYGK